MKKYRLLKDLPDLKAGAVFKWEKANNQYICNYNEDDQYQYTKEVVETTNEWFEPIWIVANMTLTQSHLNKLKELVGIEVQNDN